LGEDFFGFKELGLDKEFGMISLSVCISCILLTKVPLRLLQGRMRAVINPSADGNQETAQQEHPELPPWEPITLESIEHEIGLIQNFLRERLGKAEQPYLIEDENLPIKQRPPKPRLPPTGKINTPRKRKDGPMAGGSAKKKKKTLTNKPPPPEPPPQLPTPPMAMIREEEGSDVESLFG
jgi:transcriptional activator SPT7